MTSFDPNAFERDLTAALRCGTEPVVPGFSARVVAAIRADRLRRTVVRWSSLAAAAALAFVFLGTQPSEELLNSQTAALVAREESASFNDLLGAASDLSILAPVIDKQSSIVDVFTAPGS